jgi:hypothetical protein
MNAETKIDAGPLAKLREPFPPHHISKLPKPYKKDSPKGNCAECGGYHGLPALHLDYVGHAALTDRLLDVDPLWSWEPAGFTAEGLPARDSNGGLWIKLTICGVTRYGYGAADGKSGGDAVKEMIGDALRNAAMRFGAALELWHKGDLRVEPPHDPETGEIIDAPRQREKVPGISKIKERLNAFMREGNACSEIAEFRKLVKANKDDIKAIRDANHEYWTGDGADWEGFSAWMEGRYADLTPAAGETESFAMLRDTLEQCATTKELDAWFKLNGKYVETLETPEQDKVKALYDAKETALKGLTPLTEGAFGG